MGSPPIQHTAQCTFTLRARDRDHSVENHLGPLLFSPSCFDIGTFRALVSIHLVMCHDNASWYGCRHKIEINVSKSTSLASFGLQIFRLYASFSE